MALFWKFCDDSFNFEVKEMTVYGLIVGEAKGNFIAFIITNRPIKYKQIPLFAQSFNLRGSMLFCNPDSYTLAEDMLV